MGTTVKERPAVTPNAIAQAKARAVELSLAAYAPHPVKQPDGSTIALCWNGRIARAYERLAAARLRRDTAAIEVIQAAIKSLEDKATAAQNAAEAAASTWAAMCAAVGQPCDPMEVYAPPCRCEGCAAQLAYIDKNAARAHYVEALYRLVAPNDHETPPLIDLGRRIQEGDKDASRQISGHLQRIYEAGKAYAEACAAAGVRPHWRALWPDENDEEKP